MTRRKQQAPRTRHVRCPICKVVWRADVDSAANVSAGVSRFDWPEKVCSTCQGTQRPLADCVPPRGKGSRR